MKLIPLLLLLFFTLLSCAQNNRWNEIEANGLPFSKIGFQYRALEQTDEGVLYLGGSKRSEEAVAKKTFPIPRIPFLYKSIDSAKNWTEVALPAMTGEVKQIIKDNGEIILLTRSHTTFTTTVIRSSDDGHSWDSLLELSDYYRVFDIFQRKNGNVEVNAQERKSNKRCIIRISEKKTDTIKFEQAFMNLFFTEKGYRAIENTADSSQILLTFNSKGKELSQKTVTNKEMFGFSKEISDGNVVLFDPSIKTHFLVIKNNAIDTIDLRSINDFNAIMPFVEDSLVIMSGYYNQEPILGAFYSYSYLISTDSGKTWKDEEAVDKSLLVPAFLKDGRFFGLDIAIFQERQFVD